MKFKSIDNNLQPTFEAFNYQHDAFEAIKNKDYFGVFHEQGLGKTKIGIDLALHWLKEEACDVVIFCTKKNLVKNWEDEIKIHTSIRPLTFSANRKENFDTFFAFAKVFICHFDLVKNDLDNFLTFASLRKVGMILDESVAIKNPKSQMSQAFHKLAPSLTRRIIMTGTPVDNRPYDTWSQIYFLDQGEALGENFKEFKKSYDFTKSMASNLIEQKVFAASLKKLKNKIDGFTLRETKASCKINLPNKEYIRIETDFEENQKNLYEKIKTEISIELKKEGKLTIDYLDFIAVKLLRLIQVSSNPATYDEGYTKVPPKIIELKRLINEIPKDDKIIIWTHFIKSALSVEKHLEGFDVSTLHGELDLDKRNSLISNFKNNEKNRILIATFGTAKEGLTLTQANHAIYFERNFSLSDYLQSQDRIHRISQVKTSYIYNLITKNSIEEWVEALVNTKHTAAQFIQGDITELEYNEQIDFNFNKILEEILLEF